MKQKDLTQNQKNSATPFPTAAIPVSEAEIEFAPSPDEVSRRAYFTYENQGSRPGHEVQHWLAAEAELIAERKLTRTHGFQHHPLTHTHLTHNQKPIAL
jgi:hypothetical protein